MTTPAKETFPTRNNQKPIRFLILGRSGSGKSSIAINPVISYTTRPQRDKNDNDHYFIKPSQINDYPDKIAYTQIGQYVYFATRQELSRALCYIIDYEGLNTLSAPEFEFISVYIAVSPQKQIEHLQNRGDSPEVIRKRLQAENRQFTELEQTQNWDYCIQNNTGPESAQEQLRQIIRFESEYPTNQERYYFRRKYFHDTDPATLKESQTRWGYAFRTFSGGFVTLVHQRTGTYQYKIISPENPMIKQITESEYYTLINQYSQTATPILITDLWNGQKGESV